jgi:hypothetical protein
VLGDREVPPGNWWSVGKEALAMLANMQPPATDYEAKLVAETQRLLSDPNASLEDRRWAESYHRDKNSSGVYTF